MTVKSIGINVVLGLLALVFGVAGCGSAVESRPESVVPTPTRDSGTAMRRAQTPDEPRLEVMTAVVSTSVASRTALPTGSPLPVRFVVEGARTVEVLEGKMVFDLPDGWYATVSAANVLVTNYSQEDFQGEYGAGDERIGFTVTISDFDTAKSPATQVAEMAAVEMAIAATDQRDTDTISTPEPIAMGSLEGYAFRTSGRIGSFTAFVVSQAGHRLWIQLGNPTSPAFSDAMKIIATFRDS